MLSLMKGLLEQWAMSWCGCSNRKWRGLFDLGQWKGLVVVGMGGIVCGGGGIGRLGGR